MTTVPSNLIPTRITQLPEYQGASTAGFLPYVIEGVTYKVQFSNIAAVGAVPSSRTITGGSGLTGGGDLSADRVISIAAGGVGFGQLADSGVVAGTYGDSANIPVLDIDQKGRVVIAGTTPIDLGAYVPITRSITAGDGLTGGGTLAANRTISLILSTAAPQSGGTPSAGTATVAAREDHVHPPVDLTDSTETSGVLPMSRGGTGSTLSPVAGAILYSDGSNVDLSNPGSANQLLFSEGTAAPTWRSLTGGATGLTFGLSGSNYALGGTLALASGGTGATTVTAARANLLPDYAGNAGRVLAVNALATDVEWITAGGIGTVTSVDVSGGTTGLTTSGGPITAAGTITLAGTLAVAHGGTGATDAATARSNLGSAASGAITSSGLTMATGRLLGRTTASTGAVQEISVGSGLTLSGGTLSATGGGGSGTVTSVDVSGGTTGVTFTGGPITTSGTITMAGTLATANGGTGQTTYSNGQLLIGKTDGTLAKATLTAGTGVSITNGDGAVTVTNSAPDQVVSLTAGTAISVSGSYPSFTVNNTAPDQTVVLTAGTGISTSGTYPNFTITNSAPDQVVSLTGAGTTSISGAYPNFTITSNDQFAGTVTSVGGTGTVNGITLTGTVTSSGNLTLGGTLSGVNLTTQVTGTLPVANGGTGTATAFTAGSVVFAGASGVYNQDNANLFWDDTNNRLGIGTTVGLEGSISLTDYVQVRRNVDGWLLKHQRTDNSQVAGLYASGHTGAVGLDFYTNNTERMRVTDTGRVGIGTSAPTTQVDVHGTGTLALRRNTTDSVAQVLLSQAGTGDSVIDFLLTGVRAWRMGIDNSDGDKFKLQPNQTADFSGAVVTVDTSGNVGIGTSSPSTTLSIIGATNPAVSVDYFETGSGGASYRGRKARGTSASPSAVANGDYLSTLLASGYGDTGFGANIGLIGFRASQNFTDAARGTNIVFENTPNGSNARAERMRIDSAGNVGIGTSAPASQLHISTAGEQRLIVEGDNANGASEDASWVEIRTDAGNLKHLIGTPQGTLNDLSIRAGGGLTSASGAASPLTFFTKSSLADPQESMRIDSAGNVGIGTSAPGVKLDVVSGAGADNIIRSSAGNAAYMVLQGTSFFSFNAVQSYDSSSNLQWSVGGGGAANTLTFSTNGANERMRITDAGNIGIGTSSPGYKLSVSGTAEITAAKEGVFTVTDGATVNLDPNNGSIQTWTLGANRTPNQANWAAGQSITLMVDDGSAFTITWTTLAVVWETDGGTAPTLATSGFTVIVLWKVGTTIYGARVGDA